MLDISLTSKRNKWCNGWSRRDFLRVGALAPLGLSLGGLFSMQKAAGAASPSSARAKSVVLVYLGGGLSHHDSFDLKPDAMEEIRGKYKGIASSVTGLRVGELLPKMAKVMNKVCLVRSQQHGNDHHETATNWVLSGRFGSPFGDFPSMGAVVAHETGFAANVPPYVAVPRNPSFTWELGKSAWLGGRYESFKAGDPNAKDYKVRDLSMAQAISPQQAERRKTLLQAVDHLSRQIEGNDQIATYDEFQRKAAEMILSPDAQAAFAIDKENEKMRDAYGRNDFGQSCLLARRLVEGGVRFVTVNYAGWDHHSKIFESLDKKLPQFDQGFATFISDMEERGLLKDTLVLCMGEFGRTPKVNKDAGRDHWGQAGSMIFAGAGVQPGKIIGATDKTGAYVTERPVHPADVAYTVYDSLGIDPRKQLRTPEGRPVEILDQGDLIKELYS
ncbi:MAG TPA: DUF1501 domain-containing protein [Verrucomicrobiae bacterium]|jgi:hypothetical protein